MPLESDPSTTTKVGSIEIELYLSGAGEEVAYGIEGLTKAAAIGYLTTVIDRMREERKYEWATCPCCREPWSNHFKEDDD